MIGNRKETATRAHLLQPWIIFFPERVIICKCIFEHIKLARRRYYYSESPFICQWSGECRRSIIIRGGYGKNSSGELASGDHRLSFTMERERGSWVHLERKVGESESGPSSTRKSGPSSTRSALSRKHKGSTTYADDIQCQRVSSLCRFI